MMLVMNYLGLFYSIEKNILQKLLISKHILLIFTIDKKGRKAVHYAGYSVTTNDSLW